MKLVSKTALALFQPSRRGRDEVAFLPAALEIVETPPSPAGRAISVTIIAAFCVALTWAYFGKMDIVASAPGRILSFDRSKMIQPFETGVVRAIHVRDGQAVKTGEVLIELDSTITNAERNHFQSDLTATKLDIARLHAALTENQDPLGDFQPPKDASPETVAEQSRLLLDQTNEHRAKLAGIDRQIAQKKAELGSIDATIAKLEATIPMVGGRVDIRKALLDDGLGSKITYLETLQLLTEQQGDLTIQKSRRRETEAALDAATESRTQNEAEYRRTLSTELVTAQQKAAGLAEDVIKATQRSKLQVLTSPVSGVVQQLSVHSIGGVVTPAQVLLVVVPSDSRQEIEATVSNSDIGFVHAGQNAEIKVDTFTFTRYGVIHGKVLDVSSDAIVPEGANDKPDNRAMNTATETSDKKGQDKNYIAHVSLDSTQMEVDGKPVNLLPGMAVNVEIKTGARTVLSYLLSPLLKYKKESLNER